MILIKKRFPRTGKALFILKLRTLFIARKPAQGTVQTPDRPDGR